MKISNSKKELARIISENGGWINGCDFAVQDKDSWVCFYEGRPTRCGDYWEDKGDCQYRCGFTQDNAIQNWHQTILSRAEYFHLYQAPDADGWIEWKSTAKSCGPVDGDVLVDVKLECGSEYFGQILSGDLWMDLWGNESIIAYRLHNPEQEKPEFYRSVMRSIPELEAKQTIEQLAAEYRNAKDYAERKQQEADAAKDDADARLAALVSAVKAVGLIPVDIVKPALDACMQLVDMVPTRLQSHQDDSVAAIGYAVNVERLYDKVRDAADSLK